MKVMIKKEDNELITKLFDEDGAIDFDYIKLINYLYEKKYIEIDVDSTIEPDLQSDIKTMFKEITDIFEKEEIE